MFRGKWTKVPCILHWTLHYIDLKKPVEGEFQIRWSRGDSKGNTDAIKLSSDSTKLVFESRFECPCLMFISKSNTVRPKIVAIELSRNNGKGKKKVYGKLSLDVGKYYSEKKPVDDIIEMETSQDIAPLFSATFGFHQIGKSDVVESVDESDLSFIGKPRDEMKTALNDWDLPSEIGEPVSQESSCDKRTKKSRRLKNNDLGGKHEPRKRTHHSKSKHSTTSHSRSSVEEDQLSTMSNDSQPTFVEENEQNVFTKEKASVDDENNAQKEEENEVQKEDENEVQKEEESNNEKEEELKNLEPPKPILIKKIVLPTKAEEEEENNKEETKEEEQNDKEEIKEEKQNENNKEEIKEKEQKEIEKEENQEQVTKTDLKEIFKPIFALSDFEISKAFFDNKKKYRFPPGIYPLYNTLLQYNVFEKGAYSNEELNDFTNFFIEEIEKSDLVKDKLN